MNFRFATYLSYHGMAYTDPEYDAQKALQVDCIQNAMRNDVLDNSHPTVLPEKGIIFMKRVTFSEILFQIRKSVGYNDL